MYGRALLSILLALSFLATGCTRPLLREKRAGHEKSAAREKTPKPALSASTEPKRKPVAVAEKPQADNATPAGKSAVKPRGDTLPNAADIGL